MAVKILYRNHYLIWSRRDKIENNNILKLNSLYKRKYNKTRTNNENKGNLKEQVTMQGKERDKKK